MESTLWVDCNERGNITRKGEVQVQVQVLVLVQVQVLVQVEC